MDFKVTQHLDAPVADVADALADPAYYERLAEVGKLGAPEVLDRRTEGDTVLLRVRFRFQGDLAPAVTAVVDPDKLTWVDESTHDLAAHRVRFTLHPDHYADRLACSGSYELTADPDIESIGDGEREGTVRRARGELSVRAPLVARRVEEAIVSGLREHLEAEAPMLAAHARGET